MPVDYHQRLPRLLRDELRDGRWLPIIGAGLSMNAVTPGSKQMPNWKSLGDRIATYLPHGYGDGGPIESISAFQELYGRPALIDRMTDELMIGVARPGDVHRAFSRIAFDSVLTTNLDFLLEEAWAEIGRPVDPIIGEQRLTARRRGLATRLIKFHGDVHHPNEAVIAESDYDGFLAAYPTLATFVASLLIRRVPVLIGYSLKDHDFRAILYVLSQRLGKNAPTPWVILAKAHQAEVDRFRRRGVKPVVLDARAKVSHSEVFTRFFEQLAGRLPTVAGDRAEGAGDQVLTELRLGGSGNGTLIVFIGSYENLGLYRTLVFPILRSRGLTPVTLDDIQSPSGLRLASLEQLLRKASVVVADTRGSLWAQSELGFLESLSNLQARVIYVTDSAARAERNEGASVYLERGGELNDETLDTLVHYIDNLTSGRERQRTQNIRSRLESGDVSFAFLQAVLTVETKLRESSDTRDARFTQLVHFSQGQLMPGEADLLREAYRLRSEFLHRGVEPPREQAIQLTLGMLSIIDRS